MKGIHVRHLNGNSGDNSKGNISIGSAKDNAGDKTAEVVQRVAEAGAKKRRKLSDDEVRDLRARREHGASYDELSRAYGIAKSTVCYIVNRKTYPHVK